MFVCSTRVLQGSAAAAHVSFLLDASETKKEKTKINTCFFKILGHTHNSTTPRPHTHYSNSHMLLNQQLLLPAGSGSRNQAAMEIVLPHRLEARRARRDLHQRQVRRPRLREHFCWVA